jgi:hypothetical protein
MQERNGDRVTITRASFSGGWAKGQSRVLFPALLLALPVAGKAQQVRLEVRAGVVSSTRLVEDQVANPALERQLGEKFDGSVRAKPSTGFILSAGAQTALRERTLLDVNIAWSRAGLDAEDGSGRRRIQTLNAGQATVGVRYRVSRAFDAGCGFGALRFLASGGLFGGGGELSPMVECGGGVHVGPGGRAVLRGVAAVHRFRTPVLRDAGGQTGSVFRLSIQAGVVVSGGR